MYTMWRNGKFVHFVNAIDGEALFEDNKWSTTEGGGEEDVPFYIHAVGAQRARGTSDGWEVDPDGNRIVCYVDKYRGREIYQIQSKEGNLRSFIEKKDLYTTLRLYHWIVTSEDQIKRERQKIDDMYLPRRISLDNVECRYLHQELQQIRSVMDHGIKRKLDYYNMYILEEKMQKRFEELDRALGLTNSIGTINTMWPTDMITRHLAEMKKLVEEVW
jgi:hypothetical protein